MDAKKQQEWVDYISEIAYIPDNKKRDEEALRRITKLKVRMIELYGENEKKWRPLYLKIKEAATKRAFELGQGAALRAMSQGAAALTALGSLLPAAPAPYKGAPTAAETAALAAGREFLRKYTKGGKRKSRQRQRLRRRNSRSKTRKNT